MNEADKGRAYKAARKKADNDIRELARKLSSYLERVHVSYE